MISTGFIKDTYAASRILKFSTESSFVQIYYPHRIFDLTVSPNGFIWNTMMRAYLLRNNPRESICLYQSMLEGNVSPDNYTYPIVFQSVTARLCLFEGKEVQSHIMKLGFHSDVYVQNTMINMYAVCGCIAGARKVFDESPVLDSVSWNSMLAGYVQLGNVKEAKLIFEEMPEKNIIASNSMIALLSHSGFVSEALQLFQDMNNKDIVSWTALISCYEQNGMHKDALIVFIQICREGIATDEVLLISILSACTHLLVDKMGDSIHGLILRIGLEFYVNLRNALIHMYSTCGDIMAAEKLFNSSCSLDLISCNSMISGYMKCGFVEKAKALFESMREKDVVTWSAMISGYSKLGEFSKARLTFHDMALQQIWPDETTLVSALSSCTNLAAIDQGKWIHAYIRKNVVQVNVILGTTLIDMYMKFGCVENAEEVFHEMNEKGVSSWNALILGFAVNGSVQKSLDTFSEMTRCGVVPNDITFVAILSACRHMGLVDLGRQYFKEMIETHKIEPNIKHFGCMVDLLGRARLLDISAIP